MRGELEKVTRDFGGPADLAVQQHQGTRTFGIERTAVQQIGERADSRQPIVQGIENVGGAFIEHHVFDGGIADGGFGNGWWRW